MDARCLLAGIAAGFLATVSAVAQSGIQRSALALNGTAQPASPYRLIARAMQRIERDRLDVSVYEAGQPVALPYFTELIVVKSLDSGDGLERLVKKNVALVPSEKRTDQWDVYTDVIWRNREGLTLVENVFIVRQVLFCSPKNSIRVQIDGKSLRLKPGQALLVLG